MIKLKDRRFQFRYERDGIIVDVRIPTLLVLGLVYSVSDLFSDLRWLFNYLGQ
jgi:hypothetical protein